MTRPATPRTHLLSNGRYSVMITDAGSGYSRWHDLAITRWREDATCDADGAYVFLRDVIAGDVWSVGYQPSGREPDDYGVAFTEDRAEIVRRDGSITSRLEVIVSPEDDVELRRVTLTNAGALTRESELTSYAEVVLASPASDAAHPAFSNLFVHTEYVSAHETLLATRRPRAPDEPPLWAGHVLAVEGETVGALEWETDRAQFLGRGRTSRTAVSVMDGRALSNTVGSVLDPIVSLRRRVRIPPGQRARLTFSTLVAPARESVLALADKYRECAAFERTATLARVHAHVQLHALGIGADEAQLFQRLASAVLYSDRTLRASENTLTRQAGGQVVLWSFGISGDRPIMLLVIDGDANAEIVTQLLRAHEYWRTKCLGIDLVILNAAAPSDAQALHALLEPLFPPSNTTAESPAHKSKGEALLLRAEPMMAQQRDVLASTARVALSSHGTLAEQIARANSAAVTVSAPLTTPMPPATTAHADVQHSSTRRRRIYRRDEQTMTVFPETSRNVVFLIDVDNTLLDNDLVTADLKRHLTRKLGADRQELYWAIFEALRSELGYADYLGALQRYRIDYPRDPHVLCVSSFLVNYPFASRLFPGSLDVIAHLARWGPAVILSDGDVVFQPLKIERSGLSDAVEGRVLVYVHKEQELDDVERRYPADHYVLVDDKVWILSSVKRVWGERLTTVFPRQGRYASDTQIAAYPAPDVTIERIGDLVDYELSALVENV